MGTQQMLALNDNDIKIIYLQTGSGASLVA